MAIIFFSDIRMMNNYQSETHRTKKYSEHSCKSLITWTKNFSTCFGDSLSFICYFSRVLKFVPKMSPSLPRRINFYKTKFCTGIQCVTCWGCGLWKLDDEPRADQMQRLWCYCIYLGVGKSEGTQSSTLMSVEIKWKTSTKTTKKT